MTRSELISRLAERFPQLTRGDVEVAVLGILDHVSEHLSQGGDMQIRGFGTFTINIRPPRIGRNPKTGERVDVPAKPAVHFKPGLEMRDRVNQ